MSSKTPIVVELDLQDPEAREIWAKTLDLIDQINGEWTLVGGLMVQLITFRYGHPSGRPTDDVDVLADARARPSETETIAAQLDDMGFKAEVTGLEMETAYRFARGVWIVDLLATDGVKTPPRTIGKLTTITIPGGTQALARSELIKVKLDDREVTLRCPSLLGAILLKSRAIMSPERGPEDREDLVRLFLCVANPNDLKQDLKTSERRWLMNAEGKLDLDGRDLLDLFTETEIQYAVATYELLRRNGTSD